MKLKRLVRSWKKDTLGYLGKVPALLRACRGSATAGQVHDLRVVLRRLRLLVRIGRPLLGEQSVAAFTSWSRRASDAAGPLRDADVAMEWLTARGGAEAGEKLRMDRRRCLPRFRRSLRPMPPVIRFALRRVGEDRSVRRLLQKRVVRRIAPIRERLHRDAGRFFRLGLEEQHEFRRRLRQWRYVREMDRQVGREPGDPPLRVLLGLQEAIGEFQNLKVVERKLGAMPGASSPALRRKLRAELSNWRARIVKRLQSAARRRR